MTRWTLLLDGVFRPSSLTDRDGEKRTAATVTALHARAQLLRVRCGRGAENPSGPIRPHPSFDAEPVSQCAEVRLGTRDHDGYVDQCGLVQRAVGAQVAVQVAILAFHSTSSAIRSAKLSTL